MPAFVKLLFTAFAQSITGFIYVLVVMMVYVNIKQNAILEESWLGLLRDTVKNRLMGSMLYGMIAGLAASAAIMAAGIAIDLNTVFIVWSMTLILMFLFSQRYLCFSYAGGIVSLSSLLLGWPRTSVPSVIALIGIMHLTESLLVLTDGSRYALPVVIEHKRNSHAGAFLLNRLWPVPLVILTVPGSLLQASGGGVAMPDWWPLFRIPGQTENLIMIPLAAIMSYSDIAAAQTPRQRTRETGFWLVSYSLVTLILAVVSINVRWMQYAAAVLVPVLHELIHHFGRRGQLEGDPIYGAPWRGLRVLDVYPESPGSIMGIKPGDILMNVNGKCVNSEEMFNEVMQSSPSYFYLDILRGDTTVTLEYKNYRHDTDSLGLLFVPRKSGRLYLPAGQPGLAVSVYKKITGKYKQKKQDSDKKE